jgi:nucleoside-diphosphate-sugar epimerase
MQRLLIAGAGYLGLALAERLAKKYEIILARRTASKGGPFQTIACDFADPQTLKNLPEVDAVYYAASADDGSDAAYERVYLNGLKNLVDQVKLQRHPPRFFLASSTSVYSAKKGELVDESSQELEQESASRFIVSGENYLKASGLNGAILRCGGIYGPGREGYVRRVSERLEPLMPNVEQWTNRIHRDDAVGMVEFLLEKDRAAGIEVFNSVDLKPEKREDVIAWLLGELHIDRFSLAVDESKVAKRGHKRVLSDKIQALGYTFAYPSFREGYAPLVAALRKG